MPNRLRTQLPRALRPRPLALRRSVAALAPNRCPPLTTCSRRRAPGVSSTSPEQHAVLQLSLTSWRTRRGGALGAFGLICGRACRGVHFEAVAWEAPANDVTEFRCDGRTLGLYDGDGPLQWAAGATVGLSRCGVSLFQPGQAAAAGLGGAFPQRQQPVTMHVRDSLLLWTPEVRRCAQCVPMTSCPPMRNARSLAQPCHASHARFVSPLAC